MLLSKNEVMEYYRLGSLFLDISLGLMVVGAIVRLIVAAKYFKSNGNKKLNEVQIKKLRKYSLPIILPGLLLGIASVILLLL